MSDEPNKSSFNDSTPNCVGRYVRIVSRKWIGTCVAILSETPVAQR